MNRQSWFKIVAVLVTLGVIGYFYYEYSNAPTKDWDKHFSENKDAPYGTELLHNLLKSGNTLVTIDVPLPNFKAFKNKQAAGNSYVFVGQAFFPNRPTTGLLKQFLNKGNDVFISADVISEAFFDSLLMPEETSFEDGFQLTGQIGCSMYQPTLESGICKTQTMAIYDKYAFKKINQDAAYIPFRYLNKTEILSGSEILGKIKVDGQDEFNNFASFKVGTGTLYIHTNPLIFSNYYLRTDWGFNYAGQAFGNLQSGTIFWHINTQVIPEFTDEGNNQERDNPFSVLLSIRSFRYAWYTFLIAIIVFCIFGFKRRQRAVPVIAKKANTSLEFAGTIAKLYLAGNNHKPIAMQKYQYFFNYVRSKYGLDLKSKDKTVIDSLSVASRVPLPHIQEIMNQYDELNFSLELKSKDLHNMVNAINTFYDKA